MKKNTKKSSHILHTPVLANEVMDVLHPTVGDSYLDLTAGYGGHASLVLEQTKNFKGTVLCDRDKEAIAHVNQLFDGKVQTIHQNYSDACDELIQKGRKFTMIFADLGVSSPHLDNANRGFSVLRDGPLDMRMNQNSGITAGELIDSASEKELETILRIYGEEPKAKKIAKAIIQNRPFVSTTELAECIKRTYGGYTKHHPAVRSFQALRIAVNDELNILATMLPKAIELLESNGRLAVITFHSLEDRMVKQFLKQEVTMGYESTISPITKRPIVPSPNEISFNPRARSAKLRAVYKK